MFVLFTMDIMALSALIFAEASFPLSRTVTVIVLIAAVSSLSISSLAQNRQAFKVIRFRLYLRLLTRLEPAVIHLFSIRIT